MKKCPYCGAPLHGEAAFCPYCARAVNERREICPPRRVPRRLIYCALAVLAAAVVLAAALRAMPRVYDNGGAEIEYSGFRLYLAEYEDPGAPAPEMQLYADVDAAYRAPSILYVEGGAEEFMRGVESVDVRLDSPEGGLSLSCAQDGQYAEYFPGAAAAAHVDYTLKAPGEYASELLWSISMRGGDEIRLRQTLRLASIASRSYTARDAPMDTVEELQELIDRAADEGGEVDIISVYLPPVAYGGGLVLPERGVFSLYGSVGSDGQRTAFTGPIHVSHRRGVHLLSNLELRGDGGGVGLRAANSARVRLVGCRVAGWETGALADGAWIDADQCVFEDNAVAMRFDAGDGVRVSDNYYTGDVFRNNSTAVLAGSVPDGTPLYFPDTVFSGNGTDIDNRCGLPLEPDGAG